MQSEALCEVLTALNDGLLVGGQHNGEARFAAQANIAVLYAVDRSSSTAPSQAARNLGWATGAGL